MKIGLQVFFKANGKREREKKKDAAAVALSAALLGKKGKIPTPANSGSIHSDRCEKAANVRNDYCVMMFIIIFIRVNIYLQSIIPGL